MDVPAVSKVREIRGSHATVSAGNPPQRRTRGCRPRRRVMLHLPFYNLLHGHGETSGPTTLTQGEELVNTGLTVLGRIMFSGIFLLGGLNHLTNYRQMVDYALANNVPFAGVLVPLTGLMILAGGMAMLLGYYARLGAWL